MTAADRAARRLRDLAETIVPRLEAELAKDPELRSALFAVSQYWNDNANDEVHGVIVLSRDPTPFWPHECPPIRERAAVDPKRDRCTWCMKNDSWFALDYEEETFRAWEAYCHDYASQDMDAAAAFLPYLVVRRRDDGSVEHEDVGEAVRPWLAEVDEPSVIANHDLVAMVYERPADVGARHVLADALLERGDPRGEYLSLLFATNPTGPSRARLDQLFAAHSRSWLGRLTTIVPDGCAHFGNGFVERASVYVPPDHATEELRFATPEWATVREIHFLPTSQQLVAPTMTNLRSLSPADQDALRDLAEQGTGPWAIERLGLNGSLDHVRRLADRVFSERLPRLRTLVLRAESASAATAEILAAAPLWMRLDAVHIGLTTLLETSSLPLASIVEWMTTPHLTPPEIAFGPLSDAHTPVGLWLHLHRSSHAARFRGWITIDRPGSAVTLEGLASSIAALPAPVRDRIVDLELRPSKYFAPRTAHVEQVTTVTGITTRRG